MDVVRRKYGKNGLIEAYKENLRIVLDYVAKLCDKFPKKKIIIISRCRREYTQIRIHVKTY